MTSLKVLDLFSGIGGFSLAFKSIATTVAYCEIDENCQDVLKKNIHNGLLDKAPIYDDIIKIDFQELNKLQPNMITAGFPCQDISVANPKGKGIHGIRSGLFKYILKILDNCETINICFLENSSNILNVGYKYIKRELKKRGFIIKYTLIRASDVGAYHKRLRWYCLCFKPKSIDLLKPISDKFLNYNWDEWRNTQCIIKINSKMHKFKLLVRNKMLGNSIVPQCCIYSWNTILNNLKTNNDFVTCTILVNVKPLKLILSDGNIKMIKKSWATPCYSTWHNYTHLTDRGSRLLSNQTYYYSNSGIEINNKNEQHNNYITNPLFVEILMGYPKKWTLLN